MIVPGASEPGISRGRIIQGAYAIIGEAEARSDAKPAPSSVDGRAKANPKRRKPRDSEIPVNAARPWSTKVMVLAGVAVLAVVLIGSAKYIRWRESHKSTVVVGALAAGAELSAPAPAVSFGAVPKPGAPVLNINQKLQPEAAKVQRGAASETSGKAENENALAALPPKAAKPDGDKRQTVAAAAEVSRPTDIDGGEPRPLASLAGDSSSPNPKPVVKRRRNLSEEDLRKELRLMPEIRNLSLSEMNQLMAVQKDYFDTYHGIIQDPALLLKVRPDLKSLPVRQGRSCQLDHRSAANLEAFSQRLHYLVRPEESDGQHAMPALLRKFLEEEARGTGRKWLRPEAIPALQQILMQESRPLRWLLVELLAEIPGPAASAALAQRAIFDLSPEVRALAIQALNGRPRSEYRPVLLGGLRYPWAPVADHAAEALAALRDREAVPTLVSYLKEADSSPPNKGQTLWPEVIRVRHATNCLMCHAPAATLTDPVAGWVPGITLLGTVRVQRPCMLEDIPTASGFLIRADITYLKQDFSVREPVKTPGADLVLRPRFDFLVRTRKVKAEEAKALAAKSAKPQQREAILFALRELTGSDAGTQTSAWAKLYPPAKLDDESQGLRQKW
jgi:hypothetical protein